MATIVLVEDFSLACFSVWINGNQIQMGANIWKGRQRFRQAEFRSLSCWMCVMFLYDNGG